MATSKIRTERRPPQWKSLFETLRKKYNVLMQVGAYGKALDTLEAADEAAWRASIGGLESLGEKAETHLSRCWVFRLQGRYGDALVEGREGLGIARHLNVMAGSVPPGPGSGEAATRAKTLLGKACSTMGALFAMTGEPRQAMDLFREYLSIAEEFGNRHWIGIAWCNLGGLYYKEKEYARAIEFFERHLSLARETGDKVGIGATSNNLGAAYRRTGALRKARACYEDCLSVSEEIGDVPGMIGACRNLGHLALASGRPEAAIDLHQRAWRSASILGDERAVMRAALNLARTYLEADRGEEALKHIGIAEAAPRATKDRDDLLGILVLRARLRAGRDSAGEAGLEEAKGILNGGRELAGARGDPAVTADYHRACGLVHALGNRPAGAGEQYDRALSLYEEHGDWASLALATAELWDLAGSSKAMVAKDGPLFGRRLVKSAEVFRELGWERRALEMEAAASQPDDTGKHGGSGHGRNR